MLALAFENLVFLLLIAVALLFQLLTRLGSALNKDSEEEDSTSEPPDSSRTPPPMPQRKPITDEERIRKFLEALGQAPTAKPPPPVAPRPTYRKPVVLPRVPPFGSPLPPLTTQPPDLPREISVPPQMPPARERKVFVPKEREPAAFEVYEAHVSPEPASETVRSAAEAFTRATAAPAPAQQPADTQLATLLRSTTGLREAFVLREILGPPRSSQSLDLIGGI